MIRSILFSLVLLLTFPLSLWGQSTTVSATVVDSSSQAWSGGTYTISFRPVPNQPGPYLWNGSPLTTTQFTGTMNGSGVFSVSIPSSSSITPSGSQWTFTICPSAASPCGALSLAITGSSEDISSQVTSALPPVHTFPTPMGYAYADSQVQQLPGLGQSYFNTTQKVPKYWDGSAWQTYGSGNGTIQPTPQFRLFIQPNSGTQSIAGPASTSQNAVTPILQGVANTDIFGGIANTISSAFCVSGCFFARPQTSVDTATIPDALTTPLTHGVDSEYGVAGNYFYNVGQPSAGGNDWRIARPEVYFWNQDQTQLTGGRYPIQRAVTTAGAGQYVSGLPTNVHMNDTSFYDYTRSIQEGHAELQYGYHIGDQVISYKYLHFRGGANANNDEGIGGNQVQFLEDPGPSGTITTGGAGAMVVKANFTTNTNNTADGLELVDTQRQDQTGYIGTITPASGQLPSTFATVDINGNPVTHAVSTGIATLNGACGATTIRNAPVSTACAITLTSGTFSAAAGSTVCVADWHQPEQVAVTAASGTSLTLNLAYAHASGTEVFQGNLGAGMCGEKLAVGNGATNPAASGQFTTYFIAGAPDTTHYAFVSVQYEGQQGAGGIYQLPLISDPITGGSLQRNGAGTSVTLFFVSTGTLSNWNNYTAPGSSTITVSGASPSDFNGTVTNVQYHPPNDTTTYASLTWNQTGTANESGSLGTLSLVGANNYVMYCGAEVTAVKGVTIDSKGVPHLDGTNDLEANNCPWTASDTVAQPNSYAQKIEGQFTYSQGLTLPMNGLSDQQHFDNITGPQSSNMHVYDIFDNDAASNFLNHGGVWTPPTLFYVEGAAPYQYLFNMANATDGPFFNVGCPVGGCSSNSPDAILWSQATNGGASVFGAHTYTPRFFMNRPLEVFSYIGASGQIGFLNNGGQITLPGTDGIGGYFSWIPGTNKELNYGNGAIGDSTGTMGMAQLNAGHLYAGVPAVVGMTVSPVGTTGSTTYTYVCIERTALGPSSLNATQTITNGNATLSSGNYNDIHCPAQPGAVSTDIYRTVGGGTQGKIANQLATAYFSGSDLHDTGLSGDATTPPTVGSDGSFTLSSRTVTSVQGTTGTALLSCTGTFTSGHLVSIDANGNCIDGGAPPTVIANVQVTLPTGTLTANTCSSVITTTMTGVTTTSTFTSAFASDASGVTGYGSSGGLSIVMWPTANTNNLKLCNPTASSITPGAMTLNVGSK